MNNEIKRLELELRNAKTKFEQDRLKARFAEFMSTGGMVSYIRDKNNRPIGMIISDLIGKEVSIGVSLCNFNAGDRWNKYIGWEHAYNSRIHCMTLDCGGVLLSNDAVKLFDKRVRPYARNMLMRAWTYYTT